MSYCSLIHFLTLSLTRLYLYKYILSISSSFNVANATNVSEVVTTMGTTYEYEEDEKILYTDDGSVYNWLNTISCVMFVINPIFDWLYAFFNQPAYQVPLQAGKFWHYMDTFAWGFWCPA